MMIMKPGLSATNDIIRFIEGSYLIYCFSTDYDSLSGQNLNLKAIFNCLESEKLPEW